MPCKHNTVAHLLIAVLLGTSAARCRHSDEPEYSLGFYNDTPGRITDARADWNADGTPHHESGGVMNAGVEALFHEEPRPIPKSAVVSWVSLDGTKHTDVIDIAKHVLEPRRFSGIIYLKIRADGVVDVVPLTYSERSRLAAEQKRFP